MHSNCKIPCLNLLWLVLSCSFLNMVEGEGTVASLTVQLNEIEETLRQRDTLDEQQKVEISRLADNVRSLQNSLSRYITMLEDGQMQEEGEEGSENRTCSSQLVLLHVQGSLAKLDDLQISVTSLVQSMDVREVLRLTTRIHQQQRSHLSSSVCTPNLTSIQPALTVNASRYSVGFWGRDVVRNDGIIYLAENDHSLQVLKEYLSEEDLQQDLVHKVHSLPNPCSGHSPASIIRDRHFICADTTKRELIMFDLDADRLVAQRSIRTRPRLAYIYWPYQKVDLSADESWVWMLYAQSDQDQIHIDKLDPQTLETVALWETYIHRRRITQSFMILGVLHTLSSITSSPNYIKHMYDTRNSKSRTLEEGKLVMPIASRNCPIGGGLSEARTISLNYDPWDQALYVWNCGYMEKYPIQLALQCT